jgi:hypothetical protein
MFRAYIHLFPDQPYNHFKFGYTQLFTPLVKSHFIGRNGKMAEGVGQTSLKIT